MYYYSEPDNRIPPGETKPSQAEEDGERNLAKSKRNRSHRRRRKPASWSERTDAVGGDIPTTFSAILQNLLKENLAALKKIMKTGKGLARSLARKLRQGAFPGDPPHGN
jgi:hypothetical protein